MSLRPITPDPTPEARALLGFLQAHHGKVTLSGQHNQMWHMSEPSERIERLTGCYPLVWGGEWGFSDERHDVDNVAYRPRLLDQIRTRHAAGHIVCLTYHQASPTVGEPCDFVGGVQIKLSEEEWEAVLTPGTPLHRVWAEHVDRLADALLILQAESIPVIFRPYHEMNGDWFWWGGRPDCFLRLWSMIYRRYVADHGLRNLLWAWNPDKPWPGVDDYFPGLDRVDLLGTDIYPRNGAETYPQEWYGRMKALAGDKPLALSEMSELPCDDLLARQPWSYFMAWDDLIFKANSETAIQVAYRSPRIRSNPL